MAGVTHGRKEAGCAGRVLFSSLAGTWAGIRLWVGVTGHWHLLMGALVVLAAGFWRFGCFGGAAE